MWFWLHSSLECFQLPQSPTAESERWDTGGPRIATRPRSRGVPPPRPNSRSGANGRDGRDEEGMTPRPGNSGRRSGHILFQLGGLKGGEGEQRQRDTMQTQFTEWHVSKPTRRRRSYFPSTLSRDCTSGPIWGVGAAFQSECMTNVRALIRGREAV